MMSRLLSVTLAFCLTLAVTSAGEPAAKIDIEDATQPLIDGIRSMVRDAKRGNYMAKLRKDVKELQGSARELLTQIPDKGPECDATLVIKMAAARTGSHEVLSALLATDPPTVLSGRLSLSLAFLQEVAHLMENEVALDRDVAPHLAAIIFGTDVTLDVINTADEFVKPALEEASEGKDHPKTRVRRSLDLGGGFSVGGSGLQWQSQSGNFNGIYDLSTGDIGAGYTSNDGNFEAGANYNHRTGSIGAGLTFRW